MSLLGESLLLVKTPHDIAAMNAAFLKGDRPGVPLIQPDIAQAWEEVRDRFERQPVMVIDGTFFSPDTGKPLDQLGRDEPITGTLGKLMVLMVNNDSPDTWIQYAGPLYAARLTQVDAGDNPITEQVAVALGTGEVGGSPLFVELVEDHPLPITGPVEIIPPVN